MIIEKNFYQRFQNTLYANLCCTPNNKFYILYFYIVIFIFIFFIYLFIDLYIHALNHRFRDLYKVRAIIIHLAKSSPFL